MARACIVPHYKGKGDRCECSNSRGISLLSAMGKLYVRVLFGRIRSRTDDVLGEEQCGFKNGRRCVEQFFCGEVVVRNAFDRVDRDSLWQVLSLYGEAGA